MHLDQRTIAGEVEPAVEPAENCRDRRGDAAGDDQELNRFAEGRSAATDDRGEQRRRAAKAAK